MLRLFAIWLLLVTTLVGCGGSDSTPLVSTDTPAAALVPVGTTAIAVESPETGLRLVTGRGSKGPLINATVELFELDSDGYPVGVALASTQTNNTGDWQLAFDSNDDVLVRVSGGSYVDEADTNTDNRRIVELASDQFLESVLMPGETSVAVTLYTQALLQKSRRETGLESFSQVLANNRQLFNEAYGFDVLSILPADPLAPVGSTESINYAMNVGGVANAINTLSIASNSALPEFRHILAVVEDLVDCRLDGLGIGQQQVVNPLLLEYQSLSLEQQILRFRNNNFASYSGNAPAVVNATRCDELGGSADVIPPQVLAIAQPVPFEATSFLGVSLTVTQKDALREQFVATDDRRSDINWRIDIPDELPLGTTLLEATVKDNWGNLTEVDWELVVADTTPPTIEDLEALVFSAQGDLTAVALPPLVVSDQVSPQNQIVISNNAPAEFPVGVTEVIWTAQDAVGNTAMAVQEILINSLAPQVTAPPASIDYDTTDLDFSVYFFDPDGTTLTYSIEGLPTGTGFSFDAASGVLSGAPATADFTEQPLSLVVRATDGQNTASVQIMLNLMEPNSPPVFSISQSSFAVDEDFAEITISIQPASVPLADRDQLVTYQVVFSSAEQQAEAPFTVLLNAESLELTIVARPDANGAAEFSIVADDGQMQQSQFSVDVAISVAPVNDPPQLIGQDTVLTLLTGDPFEFDLSTRVSDVDDTQFNWSAEQLPAGMIINDAGVLNGMALPADALSPVLPLELTARDSQNEAVNFTLRVQVIDPDTDGDGLSDYQESLIGFDSLLPDSDGDSFGDSLEAIMPLDSDVQAIFYLATGGDNANTGDSPTSALATLDEVSLRLAQLPIDQPTVVLIEQDNQAYTGQLGLSGVNRTVIGSVDFDTLQRVSAQAPLSTLRAADQRVLVLDQCQSCAIYDLRIDGGLGIAATDSSVLMQRLHVLRTRDATGGALFVVGSQLSVSHSHFAANQAVRGGAIAMSGQSNLTVSDTLFTGNVAEDSGGAIYLTDSSVDGRNLVFSANKAPTAAVIDLVVGAVQLANASIAYNALGDSSDTRLFRCRTSNLGTCPNESLIQLRDSVIALNRNANGEPVDLADVGVQGLSNVVEIGRPAQAGGLAFQTLMPFAVGYISDEDIVLNAGSRSSVDAQLENYFSRVASVFTDNDQVEPGTHSLTPILPISSYRPQAFYSDETSVFEFRAIDIRLFEGRRPIDASHRVSVAAISRGDSARTISPGILANDPFGAVPAISLGDGRYRIWVNDEFGAVGDALFIRLDADDTGVQITPGCVQRLCGATTFGVFN